MDLCTKIWKSCRLISINNLLSFQDLLISFFVVLQYFYFCALWIAGHPCVAELFTDKRWLDWSQSCSWPALLYGGEVELQFHQLVPSPTTFCRLIYISFGIPLTEVHVCNSSAGLTVNFWVPTISIFPKSFKCLQRFVMYKLIRLTLSLLCRSENCNVHNEQWADSLTADFFVTFSSLHEYFLRGNIVPCRFYALVRS